MALEEYDDYEQEQIIKDWLRQNWFTIFAGIALGISGLWGYAKWQNTQAAKNQSAATQYQQISDTINQQKPADVAVLVTDYEAEYGTGFYSIKARMQLAARWVKTGEMDKAINEYQAVIAAKPDKALAELARLRLARLFVSTQQFDAAREQLGLVQSSAYGTVVEEIKGDIFTAENNLEKAQDAYQLALLSGEGYSGKALLEMKLSDVKVTD